MRTREQIQCMCDGCNRTATGHRITATIITPQGLASFAKVEAPNGWRVAMVRPDVALAGRQDVDAAMDAKTLARATGAPVEAALCERCQKGTTFVPIAPEPTLDAPAVLVPEAPRMDEETAARDREREEREREAEEADRRAFEEKRAREAAQTGGTDAE